MPRAAGSCEGLRQWYLSVEARRFSAGCDSQQVLQIGICDCRSPFERSPFEKAFSSMLKGKVSADCSLAGPPSSSAGTAGGPGSSLGASSIPEDAAAPGRSVACALHFNDSAHNGGCSPQHRSHMRLLHASHPDSSMGFTAKLDCTTDPSSSLALVELEKCTVCSLHGNTVTCGMFAFCAVACSCSCEWYTGAHSCATCKY